jgi:hypothetical protein
MPSPIIRTTFLTLSAAGLPPSQVAQLIDARLKITAPILTGLNKDPTICNHTPVFSKRYQK